MFVLTLSAHITIEKGKIIELIKSKRMPIIEISSLSHPGVEIFSTLTEAQLRNRIDSDRGIFIAESPKVIQVALDAGYEPLAILCEQNISSVTLPLSLSVVVIFLSIQASVIYLLYSPDIHLPAECFVPCGVLN